MFLDSKLKSYLLITKRFGHHWDKKIYCLAQVCAIQFWSKAIHNGSVDNFQNEVKRYNDLWNKGGSAPFSELLKSAGEIISEFKNAFGLNHKP